MPTDIDASPTARLAQWCSRPDHNWNRDCLDGARRAFLDTTAVMLAGSGEVAVRRTAAAALSWGSGAAHVVGQAAMLAAPWAALINGTAAHALDYDDVLDPARSHPSAALVPALYALAEETGASGHDCLEAYLVGFEVMTRLGEAMNLDHYGRGWHTTLSLGAPGVAAACARLLRLDTRATAMAISLATSMAGGSKCQFGTMAKPLHAGLAAKNGLVAARLAQAGVSAIAEPFEGTWGYREMTSGAGSPGFAGALTNLDGEPAMTQYGIWAKPYPCCAGAHRAIDAALALAHAYPDVMGRAVRITASVSVIASRNLKYRVPADVSEARFSLPYCVCTALVDGAPGPASFTAEAITRPFVLALIERFETIVDTEVGSGDVSASRESSTVTLYLNDGRTLSESVDIPHGYPPRMLGEADLSRKFFACVDNVLPMTAAHRLHEQLLDIEALPRAAALAAMLGEARPA
ncbi:MAG TPA: MmgE/PrpD family protein [Bordetella sp.]